MVAAAQRVELFGVGVDAVDVDAAVALARAAVQDGRPHQHVVLNAAKVVAMHHDASLRETVRHCDFVQADGMPIVWLSRLAGRPLPGRVAGADLFERLVATAADDGASVYLLGAQADVVARVADVLRTRHPDLRLAGWRDGFWDDDAEVVAAVRAAAPDYLFVALPSPRKERFLEEHLAELGVPFAMGVGGSFDVVAGLVRRAPNWVQQAGLEWCWRLAQEPRRLLRRYLVGNTRFLLLAASELRRSRRNP